MAPVAARAEADSTPRGEALRCSADWADGIAFFAIEHPEVRAAAAEVAALGTKLVTIVSNLGERAGVAHVGLDNHAV